MAYVTKIITISILTELRVTIILYSGIEIPDNNIINGVTTTRQVFNIRDVRDQFNKISRVEEKKRGEVKEQR